MWNLIIRNAKIVDGTGNPFYWSDVAIQDGKIAAIGRHLGDGVQEVDAKGLVLAPGFINSHSHGDMMADLDNTFFQEVEQGVTTQIAGMCGISAAPFSREHLESVAEIAVAVTPYDFRPTAGRRFVYEDYLRQLEMPAGNNMGLFVGHGTLRAAVMGMEDREPTPTELEAMKSLLRSCLDAGAIGLSYGLVYPAGSYAKTPELVALSTVVEEYGGTVSVHLRDEGNRLVESVDEMLQVARESGCCLVLSHHKAINEPNWGKTTKTIERIEQANAEGLNVFCDQYPYTASSTGLKSRIPQHMHAFGEEKLLNMLSSPSERPGLREAILAGMTPEQRFGTTMFGASPSHPEYTGRMVLDVAKERHQDPCFLVMDVLFDDRLSTNGIYFCMQDDDVERVLRYPRTMIGSDGIYYKGCTGVHPRAFGTFLRVLGRYVRELGVLTLEDAVRKMTSLPAAVYGLHQKGLLKVGMDADMVLFNPDTVTDCATFTDSQVRGNGIESVYLGGKQIVDHGIYNGRLEGKLIRRIRLR